MTPRRGFALLAAALVSVAALTTTAAAQSCQPIPGQCCAVIPQYSDPAFLAIGEPVVGTREVEPNTGACVTIFDISDPYPGDGQDYSTTQRYHGPGGSWNVSTLGSVFGLTLDVYGNILVCETSCYGLDYPGPGGPGSVYRIANGTGAVTPFISLPNSTGVGLGNISYDCQHDQFFVTNHEDGRIYRIKTAVANGPVATVQEAFDPLGPDDGSVGFAPLGERLWGVQWHAGRVYYSVWSENCNQTSGPANTIRSVALDGSGAFIPGSDQLEIVLPPHVNGYSHPVSDISFSPKGTMLLAERSMASETIPAAHESRLLEYACGADGTGGWSPSGNTFVLGVSAVCCCSGIAGNGTNSAGGVDSDFRPYVAGTPHGRIWGTSDAINNTLTVYGIQGLPPNGGTPAVSAWLDFDGTTAGTEKTNLGDVEVPCPDVATAVQLASFTAAPARDGIELRWRFADPRPLAAVTLERGDHEAGPWAAIAAERRTEAGVTVATDREAVAGRGYWYRLRALDLAGEVQVFPAVAAALPAAGTGFELARLAPNPTGGEVEIEFTLPREAEVRVVAVDLQGRELAVLAEGAHRPGRHTVTWNAKDAGARARGGVVFVRYQTPEGSFAKRLVVTP